MKKVIILLCLVFGAFNPVLKSQNLTEGYFDTGKNQVSEGIYSHFSNTGNFELSRWGLDGGYQLGLIQPQNVILNSFYLSSYWKFSIKNFPMETGGEYLWSAFCPSIRETNWMMFVRTRINHWQFSFGTSIRNYRMSYKAAHDISQAENSITEKWNMFYNATYLLKPYENRWNLSASFTNYDHFIIQQENNPMYKLRFDYKLNPSISVFSELWYKPAGLMVIRVTYFGTFLRLGITWKL